MLQPDGISEDILVLLRHNLELTCKFELLGVNLKNSLENLRYGTVSLPYRRLEERLDLFIALTNTDSTGEVAHV